MCSVGQCLSVIKSLLQRDPRQLMDRLDAWRKSLPSKMHVDGDLETNNQYLTMRAISYRYECVLCRRLRHTLQRSKRADWAGWAKQRLRSAILELDMIALRVMASGTLAQFPTPLSVPNLPFSYHFSISELTTTSTA